MTLINNFVVKSGTYPDAQCSSVSELPGFPQWYSDALQLLIVCHILHNLTFRTVLLKTHTCLHQNK